MSRDNIAKIAIEASKLLFDNPNWTYAEAINKAKELIEDDKRISKMEKIN